MKTYAVRLLPDQDLMKELEKIVVKNNIKAGFIISCLGSLKKAHLRMPGGKTFQHFEGLFEILCLNGTLSVNGSHLHVAMSVFPEGNVLGGHVLEEGCIINTTAEIVIGELDSVEFTRKLDERTGFNELKVVAQ
ncbi:DNA-binding protein [bacterium]|nr:DNA-binding protein [bacterium]